MEEAQKKELYDKISQEDNQNKIEEFEKYLKEAHKY